MTAAVPPPPPTKAVIRNLDGGSPLTLPFNPSSFKLGRSVNWKEQTAASQAYPTLQFVNGGMDTMEVTFLLDSTETTTPILPLTQTIYGWTIPAVATGRPPGLVFSWATFSFLGAVQSVGIDFLIFDATGAPKRAMVTLSLTGRSFAQGASSAMLFGQQAVTIPATAPQIQG